jgi:ATP-dependent DNA helicase RecG
MLEALANPFNMNDNELSEYEKYPLFALLKEKSTPLLLLSEDEIYDLADAELLRSIKEDSRIERKSVGIRADALGDYLCMWSNTPPNGGLIAVGIENNSEPSGCIRSGVDHLNSLESSGMTFCQEARYVCKKVRFTHPNGEQDFILLFRVKYNETKVVRNNKSEVYARFGDKKRRLTDEQVRELEIDKGQTAFEQDPSTLEYPTDFDIPLIRDCAERFRKSRELRLPLNDEEILELLHLGKIKAGKFYPNNACVIVFAKDPREVFPGCRIRFFRFRGEEEGVGERWSPQKDVWSDMGGIPHQIRHAEAVIDSQLRTFTRLGMDNKFHTTAEYPKTAWYEALVNACVHRSYNLRNMNIFVKMFDDRIEIESPGGFPPFVTPENIYTSHNPRNPKVFDAMQLLGFVVGAREGTRRMRDSMLKMELPLPEFVRREHNFHSVLVRLRNDYKQRKVWLDADAVHVVGEAIFKTLTQDEKRAINLAAEHGEISVSDFQRLTQKTWHTSKRILENLKQKGILLDRRRKGIKKDTKARYFLNK